MHVLLAAHLLDNMRDLVDCLVYGPIKGDYSQEMVLIKPKCSILKFRKELNSRGFSDQRSDRGENWLYNLDKMKLRKPKDVRELRYKNTYYPAKKIAREVWLDCASFDEFCGRCGFYLNSTIANDWDFAFSKIYNRKLKASRSKSNRQTVAGLAEVLKMTKR